MLHRLNPYVQQFQQLGMEVGQAQIPNLSFVINVDNQTDRRVANRPTASEVAVIIPQDGNEGADSRNVMVRCRNGQPQFMKETHPAYDPLAYVLLFPEGELGWDYNMRRANGSKALTAMDFYCHRFQVCAIS